MPVKRVLMDPSVEGQMQTLRSVQDVLQSVPQTTSYTLTLSDRGKVVDITAAGATVLTVPLNSSVPFPIGTVINVGRWGLGAVTIAGAVGVTVRTASTLSLRTQYSEASLRKVGTDEWIATGDLAAATDPTVGAGIWTDYTPTLRNGSTNVAKTVTSGRYTRIGNTVWVQARLDVTGAGAAGDIQVGLPVDVYQNDRTAGTMAFYDASANTAYNGIAYTVGKGTVPGVYFVRDNTVSNVGWGPAMGSGDVVWYTGVYETA